jgi:hypothetical protein
LADAALEANVVPNGLENPYELFVEVTRVHGTALRLPIHKHLGNV